VSPKEKHPHIESASEEQLTALLQDKSALLRQLYLDTHRLVLESLPRVTYSTDCTDGVTGYGIGQYGYGGWGMLALAAHANWVSLMFFRGADLQDQDGLLEGTGKKMRHVKLRSSEQFAQRCNALRTLIEEASRLNERDIPHTS
jgi:hypothetical protein